MIWEFLSASPAERRVFATLEHALSAVSGPAAPANRYRQVHRIEADGQTYFLKEFKQTQWKNRCRSRLTQPRCVLDGDRERLVAHALHERGFAVARPVALGRRGQGSYYLCAELPGESLLSLASSGRLDRTTAMAAARFAGGILASGVMLPDLAADHVFLLHDASFAVIDLHNGRLSSRLTRRMARRVLRHFAASVRGLDLPRASALGFATRVLATAGVTRPERRSVIERTAPMDTHSRYEVPGKSTAYRRRSTTRTREELELLAKIWPGQSGDLVLDSPAGVGRLATIVKERFAARRVGVDRSMSMLREGKEDHGDLLIQADARALPVLDRCVDGVVVFRFLHHLPPSAARAVLGEATRVARGYVVVSFFHPISAHGVARRTRELLTRKPRSRFSLTSGTLRRWMVELGFEQVGVRAQSAFLRDFWLASFRRRDT